MIKGRYGERLDAWMQRRFGPWLRRAPPPLWWSLAGVACSAIAGGWFAFGSLRAGALWLAAGAICDLLDGPVARAQKRASAAGAFLDSCCDRVSDLAIYLGLLIGLSQGEDMGVVALAAAALGVALLTSYVKARAECVLPKLEVGAFERGERLAVLGVGAYSGWLAPALGMLVVAGGFTVFARFRAAYARIQADGV